MTMAARGETNAVLHDAARIFACQYETLPVSMNLKVEYMIYIILLRCEASWLSVEPVGTV